MTDVAISLAGLHRTFGEHHAVRDLSFAVHRGELFGLVGPDGAGKTTTLRMLAGVMAPSRGDASVNGISVTADPEGVKGSIAYMSQRFGLYTDLTVRENIDFYADLYRVPRATRPERLERLYAFSNLGTFEHRLAGQLSGGMKQKLSLCCALIHQPAVMLLDEPTFGVDPISRRDLWLIIHQMVTEGTTVLVSTAYLDEAERCDRVGLLHDGRLIALDTPDRLQNRLANRVAALYTARPRDARDVAQSLDLFSQAMLFGESLHVVADHLDTALPVLTGLYETHGIRVDAVRRIAPSLEDVFIHLVREADRG